MLAYRPTIKRPYLQADALQRAGCHRVYQGTASGKPGKAGLTAARARGRLGGRKPKLNAKQIKHIKALLSDPKASVTGLARDYGVPRTTIYKHCGVS